MTTKTEEPKRKRGRPKKVTAIKPQIAKDVKEPESKLHQIWNGRIYHENELSLVEAGRITFYTKSNTIEVVPLREGSAGPGWKAVQRQLSEGLYTFSDAVTGNTRDRLLSAEESAEAWIEGIEHMKIVSPIGGYFVMKDLKKRFDDSEEN